MAHDGRVDARSTLFSDTVLRCGCAVAVALLAAGLRWGLHERRPGEPVPVYGDAARLAQVLGNLLHNALKFTERGGDVCVELERQGSEAVLRVRDTGVGIAPDDLPRIFELFAHAEQQRD